MKTSRLLSAVAVLTLPSLIFAQVVPVNPNAEPAGGPDDPDTAPVVDSDPEKANPDAEPVKQSTNPTAPASDTTPVVDSTPERANPDAEPVEANEPNPVVPPSRVTVMPPAESDANEPRVARTARAEEPEEDPRRRPVSREAGVALEDRDRRDRNVDRASAERIEDEDDAANLVHSILGAPADAVADRMPARGVDHPPRYRRLPARQVGRSPAARERSVDYLVRRLSGDATLEEAPPGFFPETPEDRDPRSFLQPRYYDGNRRVVLYPSRRDVPPIHLALGDLNRVQVTPYAQTNYQAEPLDFPSAYEPVIPEAYRSVDAYAVSYRVDPDSAVSRDDILFQQGSTAFFDAYSVDIVADLAEAMTHSALQNESFVVEGHASAEGDYAINLHLSQERAERVARDLVGYGVSPDRLIPIGYGETEAKHPPNAPEDQRALDRRVMVFRME
ncbi:MAG: OmpA family protein [Verrucomicrobiales bacterium]